MSGFSYALHYDTITIEEYRRYRLPQELSSSAGVRVDERSIEARRLARYDNSAYTGVERDL